MLETCQTVLNLVKHSKDTGGQRANAAMTGVNGGAGRILDVDTTKDFRVPRIAIDVLLKPEILDPQGRAVERALPGLGHGDVSAVRIGKHLELDVAGDEADLDERVETMCRDFLTNPVIETYTWRVLDPQDG